MPGPNLLLVEGCEVGAGWGWDKLPLLRTRACPWVPTRSAILLLLSFARRFADLLVPVAQGQTESIKMKQRALAYESRSCEYGVGLRPQYRTKMIMLRCRKCMKAWTT